MQGLDELGSGHLIEGYRVVDVLGRGGMAIVYRVRHERLGSYKALKVVAVPSRSVMLRIMSEGRAQARVRHRNILGIENVVEVDGSPCLILEYVEGPSLDRLIGSVQLDLDRVDALGRGILRGIAAAHAADVIHRDLKPANILVSVEQDGLVPKIADFGLAKDFTADSAQTRSGAFLGTPNYMSPEQVRDAKHVDTRADLWAAGAVLYELVTGRRAFEGSDMLEVFNRVAQGDYVPVRAARPDVPERMARAIESALVVDPDARVATAEELLAIWSGGVPSVDQLDPELLARVRVLMTPPPADTPADSGAVTLDPLIAEPPPRRRRRAPVAVLGLTLTAALAMFVLLQVNFSAEAPPKQETKGEHRGPKTDDVKPNPSPRPPPPDDPGPEPEPEPERVQVTGDVARAAVRFRPANDTRGEGAETVPATEEPQGAGVFEVLVDGVVVCTVSLEATQTVRVSCEAGSCSCAVE